jgi:glycerol-3-phosphate acyltransferase PlsX
MESSLRGKVGYMVARSAFKQLSKRMDPRLYNGAILLGLRGIAVKSHGGTDEIGYSEAIKVAIELASQTNEEGEPLFNQDIQHSIARLQAAQHMDVA